MRLLGLLIALQHTSVQANYALGSPDPMCWVLGKGNTPMACPKGLAVDWVAGSKPPVNTIVGLPYSLKVSLDVTTQTFQELEGLKLLPTNMTASKEQAMCFTGNACKAKAKSTECCYFHVNMHACLDKPGSFCGPWLGNDGRLASHSPAQNMQAGANGKIIATFPLKLFFEGGYMVIAHFKFAGMHFAIGHKTNVVFGGDVCPSPQVPKPSKNMSAPQSCEKCPLGAQPLSAGIPTGAKKLTDKEAADSGLNPFCISCPPGMYSNDGALCKLCLAGSMSNNFSQKECKLCSAGTYQSRTSSTTCLNCATGAYAPTKGMSRCKLCGVNSYSDTPGSLACKRCGAGTPSEQHLTTMHKLKTGNGTAVFALLEGADSKKKCGCKVGMRSSSGKEVEVETCVSCIEGMSCLGMDDVTITPGYSSDSSFSVYRCYGNELRCVGGIAGNTCAKGRKGISCAECEDGMMPVSADGTCVPCEGSDLVPFVFCVLGCLVLLTIVYHVVDTKDPTKQSHGALVAAICCGLVVTVVQQLSIVGKFSLEWPEPMGTLMKVMSIFVFDVEVIKVACVAPMSPLSVFVTKIIIVLVALLAYFLVHIVFVVVRHGARPANWKQIFGERMYVLIGGIGQIFMVFFLSVSTAVLGPMQCMKNPNEQWTVRGYQSVVCWGSDMHLTMFVISCFGALIPLGFLSWCVWAVVRFPSKMREGDVGFLRAYGFLFFRTRVEVYGYVVLHICRCFLISITPLIPNIVAQLMIMQLIMVSQLATTIQLAPYRVWQVNVLEVVFTCGILVIVFMGAVFVDVDGDSDSKAISTLASVVVASILICGPLVCLYAGIKSFSMRGRKTFEFFLCHYKAGEGSLARLLKMFLVGSSGLNKRATKEVFLDSDNLLDLDKLFDYVGNFTDTFVVMCSSKILTRPWCMGELVTGQGHGVNTIKVILPGFTPPNEDFIQNYDTYVPDITCLAERGISLVMVQDMIKWLDGCASVTFPVELSKRTMNIFCDALVSAGKGGAKVQPQISYDSEGSAAGGVAFVRQVSNEATTCVVNVDRSCLESIATAQVLACLLAPRFAHSPHAIPWVLESAQVPNTTTMMLVICSGGAFAQKDFLSALLGAARLEAKSLPILADETFRFPTKEFLDSNLPAIKAVTDSPEVLLQLILDVFKSIAVVFQPAQYSSTVEVLETKADQIAKRLTNVKLLANLTLTKADPKAESVQVNAVEIEIEDSAEVEEVSI